MGWFQEASKFDILLYQTSNHQNLISNNLICWCIKLSNHQIWWSDGSNLIKIWSKIWCVGSNLMDQTDATHQNLLYQTENCYNRPSKYLMIWWIKYLILISKSNLIWWFDPSTNQIFDVLYQNIKSDGSNIWYWYQNQILYWYQNQIIWWCNFDEGGVSKLHHHEGKQPYTTNGKLAFSSEKKRDARTL